MNGGGNNQPRESATITADRTQITTYSSALNVATTEYNTKLTAFKTDFMKHDDYANAQKAVDQANKELDAARTVVITWLKANDPAYRAANQKETDSRKKLDQIRANGGNRDQISAQSQAILDAGDSVSKIEGDKLAKDIPYQEAKKKLADAVADLDKQKTAMNDAIAADDDLKTKKTALDTAKTNLDDANKKLRQDLASGA